MTDWTAPRTWSTGDALTAALMNEQLRDNLTVLKDPASEMSELTQYSTTSTSWTDVDGTNLSFTITTEGGDVIIGFSGTGQAGAGGQTTAYFDVDIDGTRMGGDDGLIFESGNSATNEEMYHNLSFVLLKEGLSAGSHTFKLQWKVSGGTWYLLGNTSATGTKIHPQFWVREVS